MCVALFMWSTHCSSSSFWIVVWDFVETGVAVCVVAASLLLVEVLVVVLSRVVPWLAVGVAGQLELLDNLSHRGIINVLVLA